ncbi:AMP-dependent synthetase/ligase [Caballeronia peredens]|nr:AMP-dependent synthetase/ligase [Caballeronia peredens]
MNNMQFTSYVEALLDQLAMHADSAVLRYRGQDVTGAALRGSIYRYARALEALDVGRGSFVAMFAPNCPDALAVRYASNLLGAATMFLPAIVEASRRDALLARLQPTHLIAFAETAGLMPDTTDARIAYIGAGPEDVRLDERARTQSDAPMPGRAHADDLAVVVCSGGTTGLPKASCRSFAAYSGMVKAASDTKRRQLVNGALAYLSQVLVDMTLAGGGTVVLADRYDAASTLETIEAERITDMLLVEPQLFETMDHPDVARRDLSSLRSIAHVGGSAPAVLRGRAMKRLGPVLTHMYGASEAGLVSVLPASEASARADLLSSAGRVRAGVDVRVRCSDGSLAHDGEAGSIEVKSAAVAAGYRNQPDEQAKKFVDGWCLMGDIGYIDAEGYLHILGRAADVAQIDGLIIGPTQIEDVLCSLPDVRYAVAFAAIGASDGRAWTVAVEPWHGRMIDVERCTRVLSACFGACVANALRVAVFERVPLTEQGKPDRVTIEKMCASPLDVDMCTDQCVRRAPCVSSDVMQSTDQPVSPPATGNTVPVI